MNNLLVISGTGHLMGRLASICAKELLSGKKIVIVNCENLEVSGKEIRKKFDYFSLSNKKTSTNPKRGPFHFKSPSKIFWKVIRGMLPHKTKRGTNALINLRTYEGTPTFYRNIKKLIVPKALRILKIMPGRNYSKLGNISNQIGWGKNDLINSLNEECRVKHVSFYNKKRLSIGKKISSIKINRLFNVCPNGSK